MLLSRAGNFIYLKTHKTGSTTVELALEPFCAPIGHKVIRKNKHPLITSNGIVGARSGGTKRRNNNDFFWNHMNCDEVIKRIGVDEFFTFNRVAAVRNPFKKFVSQFYFRYSSNPGYKMPKSLNETRAAFEDFIFSPYRGRFGFRNKFLYILSSKKNDFFKKKAPLHPCLDNKIVMFKNELVITHFIRNENITSDLKEFCISSKLDPNILNVTHERDNSSKKKYNHLELFYKKSLINRVIDLEGWVFDAVGYSKEPENA